MRVRGQRTATQIACHCIFRFLGSAMSNKNSGSGDTDRDARPIPPQSTGMTGAARFYIGVDGGGSGTRVLIAPHVSVGANGVPESAARTSAGGSRRAANAVTALAGGQPDAGETISWPLRGLAGPSGLGLGIERAWEAITRACTEAFAAANLEWQWSDCVMACGLAGVNHVPWRDAFIAGAPPLQALSVFSDAFTTWAGALGDSAAPPQQADDVPSRLPGVKHAERERRGRVRQRIGAEDEIIAGVVIALGTGSIGCAMDAVHGWRTVGGFGFPAGDEASGAWFGLQAAGYAQRAFDGRVPIDAFARALIDAMSLPDRTSPDAPRRAPTQGETAHAARGAAFHPGMPNGRDRLQGWLTSANQTDYATLMRVVVAFSDHPTVQALRARAAADVDAMIDALDPTMRLPVVLAGSIGPWLADALASRHRTRLRAAAGDAAVGALRVAQGWIKQPTA